MRTLRLTQTTVRPGEYTIELALEGDGQPRQTATAPLAFTLSPEDQADLRWYLEDYLQYPEDPAPAIAARIEARMREIGIDLFEQVLEAGRGTRRLWDKIADHLADTRVEIRTGVLEAATIPWELLHDPLTDVSLALRAHAFVRVYSEAAQEVRLPECEEGDATAAIRILLVICRPGRDDDVPFRSVAMRLLEGLNEETSQTYQLDVLRPPTYEQLGRVLRKAKAEGKPYHIVHFDGHGVYTEVEPSGGLAGLLRGLGTLVLSAPRTGTHGYLLFENPQVEENAELVDGPSLGALLAETSVPVLVLNACRSAHAEAQEAPSPTPPLQTDRLRSAAGEGQETPAPVGQGRGGGVSDDIHTQVRAFGSLAQEAMDAGVAGVVAMRYNVYVVTAAQFVADLYAALAQGQALGQAVTMGRKQLHDQPLREIAFKPRPLQDWAVPVVYKAAPIELFRPRSTEALRVTLRGRRRAGTWIRTCPRGRTPAFTGGTRRCWPWTGPSTRSRSSCCTPTPGAARRRPPPSSPAGMR